MLRMVACCVLVDGYTFKQLHLHAIRLIQFCILFCQSPNFKICGQYFTAVTMKYHLLLHVQVT